MNDRSTHFFRAALLLLCLALLDISGHPVGAVEKGDVIVLKLGDTVSVSQLLARYPELNTYINESQVKPVFSRKDYLGTSVKKLERKIYIYKTRERNLYIYIFLSSFLICVKNKREKYTFILFSL